MGEICVWQELLTMAQEVAKLGAKAIFLELPGAVQLLNLAGEELLREAKLAQLGEQEGVEEEA